MVASIVDISLPKIGCCLRIEHAPAAVSALCQAMPGWPATITPPQVHTPTQYIYQDIDGLWQGSFDEPNEYHLPSPASAACSLVGDLISQRLAVEPELLGLHCGSVEINGRLVLFPQSSKAGKSTLTVAFAAAGYRIFGDDVLGLSTTGQGVAMGVAPRLRLPLPVSFSKEFVEYTERHAGPEDDRYRFVIPPNNGLARFDESSPVGHIVLLERDEHISEPEVIALSPGEGLLQLLCQNFARDSSNEQLVNRFLPLMQSVPCLLLRYSEPLAAVRHLAKVIQCPNWQPTPNASLVPSPLSYGSANKTHRLQQMLENNWSVQPQVSAYPLGEELFLIHTASGAIHRLNASGKIVWQLLQQEPLSGLMLSEVLAKHYRTPLETVTADISNLINALAQSGLITAHE